MPNDVSDLLQGLRSPDERRRIAAVEEFRMRAMHQESIHPAAVAAVPHLIELFADDDAPDRTLGHELLVDLMPGYQFEVDQLSGVRPHPLGPRLRELAERRSDWYVDRLPEWRQHGPRQEPRVDPVVRQAYEAVRAGVPTYLELLGNDDRDARGLSAHLLSFFPEEGPRTLPALTARMAVEQDQAVGSFLCLAAGMIGDPGDADLIAAVSPWRDRTSRFFRWTVLMGLVRLTVTADADMLADLCDCLFRGPVELDGWAFHGECPVVGAATALGDLPVRSLPGLADLLLDGLAAGGDDFTRFMCAVTLLLSLVFPEGPLPDGTGPGDLTPEQGAAVDALVRSGLLDHPGVARLLRECNVAVDSVAS